MRPTFWNRTILIFCTAILLGSAVVNPESAPAESNLALQIILSNSIPVVTWQDPAAKLERTLFFGNEWILLTNASSPYLAMPSGSTAFFRLRVDCLSLPGIVSWWPGDGNATCLVGTNQGTPMGGCLYAKAEVGQAFSLDGTSGWVDIPNSEWINPTGPFSVECWIKAHPQQFSSQALIVDKSHGWTDGTGWAIQTSPTGQAGFLYGIGGPTGNPVYFPYVVTTNSVLDDQWHHLAGVWNGNRMEIYEDGVLHDALSETNLPASNLRNVEIGRSWGGGNPTRFFRGLIDEVTYFGRTLSSDEVSAIFNAGAAGKCKP